MSSLRHDAYCLYKLLTIIHSSHLFLLFASFLPAIVLSFTSNRIFQSSLEIKGKGWGIFTWRWLLILKREDCLGSTIIVYYFLSLIGALKINRKPKMSTLFRKDISFEAHKASFVCCFSFQSNFYLYPEIYCPVTLITDKEKGNQSHHDYSRSFC